MNSGIKGLKAISSEKWCCLTHTHTHTEWLHFVTVQLSASLLLLDWCRVTAALLHIFRSKFCVCFFLNRVSCPRLPVLLPPSPLLHTDTEPSLELRHHEKQSHIWLYIVQVKLWDAAHAVFIHIIAEWWRHAPTELTPQVLKSSIPFLSLFLSFFYLNSSSRLHSSPLSVHVHHFAPHHLLFFICRQMISETSLIPSPTPSSFPLVSLALFLIVCLSFTLSFLCSSGRVASLLFLYSCHLTCLFFPLFWPFYSPHPTPVLFPLIQSFPNFPFLSFCPVTFLWR